MHIKGDFFTTEAQKFSVAWADIMEAKLNEGAVLSDIVGPARTEAGATMGLSSVCSLIVSTALKIHRDCWVHGAELNEIYHESGFMLRADWEAREKFYAGIVEAYKQDYIRETGRTAEDFDANVDIIIH